MKLIIRDHLRRWWWVWMVGAILQCVLGWFSSTDTPPKDFFVSLMAIFLGPFLLQFDMQRGFIRTIVSLPLTAKKIGRTWWLAVVALPALMVTMIAFLSAGVSHLIHPELVFPVKWLALNCTISTAWLGTSFVVLLGFSNGQVDRWWEKLRNMIFGVLWGGSIGGWSFVSKYLFDTPTKTMWALIVGGVLTLIGWLLAERMVTQRAAMRPGVQFGRRQPGQHKAPAGFGGLPYLWQHLFIRVGRFALVFVVYMIVMQAVMRDGSKLSPKQLFEASLPALSSFSYFFMYLFLVLPMLMQLRSLRALPISTSALAATLVLTPAAPILLIGLVWAAVGGGVPDGGNGFHISDSFLTAAASVAIGVPIFVWQGMKSGAYVLVVVLMVVSTIGPVLFNSIQFPPAFSALFSIGFIALAFELTRRLLQSSSRAYRPPPAMMTGWGGAGWSGWR